MKAVTEFWGFNLVKGLKAKEALTAEGKTAEEIQTSIGETFKLEGDKLKHFVNAMDVASKNLEKLHRVVVVSIGEGEAAPQNSTKVEEGYYIPHFVKESAAIVKEKADPKTLRQNKPGGSGERTKTSPWGLTPEEKAKKGGAAARKA